MANAILAYGNLADSATLTRGSWVTTLPRDNLKNRIIAKVARTTDATLTSTTFDVDVGLYQTIRVIALVGHNLSLSALYRVRTSNVSGFGSSANTLTDTGWVPAWPALYNSYDLNWEDSNWWSGTISDTARQGYNWTNTIVLPTPTNAEFIRVEIDDQANAAGYVQIGRLFVGAGWQPVVNMEYGASLGWETGTTVETAYSGTEYFDERKPFRVARFKTNWASEDEGMQYPFEIMRQAGISREVLYIHNPDDTVHALRRQFIGRLRQLNPVEYPYPQVTSTAWEVKELI